MGGYRQELMEMAWDDFIEEFDEALHLHNILG